MIPTKSRYINTESENQGYIRSVQYSLKTREPLSKVILPSLYMMNSMFSLRLNIGLPLAPGEARNGGTSRRLVAEEAQNAQRESSFQYYIYSYKWLMMTDDDDDDEQPS